MKTKIKRKDIVLGFLAVTLVSIFIIGYPEFGRKNYTPHSAPSVTIKYDGEKISTKIGFHTWFYSDTSGGNSYLAPDSYELGNTVSSTIVKANTTMEIFFKSAPPKMILNCWEVGNSEIKQTTEFDSSKKYTITLPNDKKEYIFEVMGYWKSYNYTSTIFKVKVE